MKTSNIENQKGYKKTKLGWIPDDWDIVNISDVGAVTAGGTPSTRAPSYWDGDIRWMNSGELNLKYVYEVEGRITRDGLKNSSARLLPKHCVLIGLAGQGRTRGTVAVNMVELCTNQSVAAIASGDKVFYHFLFYNLDSRYDELRKLSTGEGGRGGLNLAIIRNIQIALPPLPEQRKIALILSTWDRAIEKTEQLIAQKQQIKKGLMQQLLTGKMRFKEFARSKWLESTLGELIIISSGETKPNSFSESKSNHFLYPVYGGNGISGFSEEKNFSGETLCIGRVGEYCGVVHHLSENAWITDNCLFIREFKRKVNVQFLYYLLVYQNLNRLRNKGGQPKADLRTESPNSFVGGTGRNS